MNNMLYEIWSEGWYQGDEGESQANFHGKVEASSFEEACVKLAESDPKFGDYFNREAMTHWGCQLFDNEADARKRYG